MRRYSSPLYRSNRNILKRRYMANDLPCAYCGLPIDFSAPPTSPLSFTVDHIIPVNSGGSDVMENLVGAHRACNLAKSDHIVPLTSSKDSVKPTRKWW